MTWKLSSIGRAAALATIVTSIAACESTRAFRSDAELAPIHYNYIHLVTHFHLIMDITPDGKVAASQQTGSDAADIRRVTGQLTAEQKSELLQVFANWNALPERLPADVTPLFEITYGDHRVVAGNIPAVPAQFTRARVALDAVARAILAQPRTAGQP